MFSFARARTHVLIASTALALGATIPGGALLAGAAHANTAGPGLVINEVYGGGGNAGATLKNDFIELKNPHRDRHRLDGLSLQYRSAGGDRRARQQQRLALPGVDVPAGRARTWSRLPPRHRWDPRTCRRRTPPARLALSRHRRPGLPRRPPRPLIDPGPATSPIPASSTSSAAARPATTSFETAHGAGDHATPPRVTRDAAAPTPTTTRPTSRSAGPSPRPAAATVTATPPPPPDRAHDRRDPGHRRPPPRWRGQTGHHHRAWSPRRTRPVASTATTSRPPAPAARPTRPPAPPTRSSSSAGGGARDRPAVGDCVQVTGTVSEFGDTASPSSPGSRPADVADPAPPPPG